MFGVFSDRTASITQYVDNSCIMIAIRVVKSASDSDYRMSVIPSANPIC